MQRKVIILVVISFTAILPSAFLLSSYLKRLDRFSGQFTRTYINACSNLVAYNLGFNSFYIAGSFDGNIYLGNKSILPRLLKMSMSMHDTESVKIDYSVSDKASRSKYRIIVDSPNFHIAYGTSHLILSGWVNSWKADQNKLTIPYFIDCIPLPSGSLVFRYISANSHENSFRKVTFDNKSVDNSSVLEKQVDGQICTSGILEYNKHLNILTYLYNYRNQILILDTNLKLIKSIKTIDDIDTVRFTVSQIKSTGQSVITNPTIMVNPRCATYQQFLLVQSKIMGKKEDDKKFEHSIVIDIYDISKGEYLYSISLHNATKSNISQMKVIDGYLYLMIGKYIQRYKISLPTKAGNEIANLVSLSDYKDIN